MLLLKTQEKKLPTPETVKLARASTERLARFLDRGEKETVSIQLEGEKEAISVPLEAFQKFVFLLNEMSEGNAVTIVPIHAELTTTEAAEILSMSRQYVVELIEKGELPAFKVGTHHRLKTADVLKFRQERKMKRKKTLEELAALSQEMGLYD